MRFEQRVSMLSDKNGQRSYLAKNLRNTFVSIITPFKKKLDKLLLDKEERERIIENPNDILTFSAEVGKTKKRIQGYNVMKALTEAYYFVSGFNYLITQGELSGAGLLIERDDINDESSKEENIILSENNTESSSTVKPDENNKDDNKNEDKSDDKKNNDSKSEIESNNLKTVKENEEEQNKNNETDIKTEE